MLFLIYLSLSFWFLGYLIIIIIIIIIITPEPLHRCLLTKELSLISYLLCLISYLLSLISLAVEDKCEVAEFEEKQK